VLALEASPEAEADLLDIWLFIANDQPLNADRFLNRLQATALRLAEFPDLGRDRPELAVGLKSFPLDRYNLYYRVTDTALVLVRVLSGSRDVDVLL
jgi:toxin ParE1/3/4